MLAYLPRAAKTGRKRHDSREAAKGTKEGVHTKKRKHEGRMVFGTRRPRNIEFEHRQFVAPLRFFVASYDPFSSSRATPSSLPRRIQASATRKRVSLQP